MLTNSAGLSGSPPIVPSPDTDLTTLLKHSSDSQSQVYSHALHLLESLRTSPSCHRLAASTLIQSCQSIDGSSTDSEQSLEDLKSIYAAQLAICEVTDAGSGPPRTCDPFLPSNRIELSQTVTHSFSQHGGLVSALKDKLGLCLQTLESRPQHWTSYSNNRQNAVVMCQAARINIEKDEVIKIYKSMADTTSGTNSALARAVAAANEAMNRQEEFGREVKQLQQQLTQGFEAAKAESQSYLGSLMKTVDSALQEILKKIYAKVNGIGSEADKVHNVLQSSATEAKALQSNIGRVFQQVLEGSAELAATQASQWDATSSSTAELRSSLQGMREHDVGSLLGAFDSIHGQLRVSNELVAVMYTRQHEMDERLSKLDRSLAGLESTAAALHATQTEDAKAQLHLHNQVQIELQVAQGLLADITASAANLQSTVRDTSSKVAHMVALGSLTSMILNWGWSLVIIFILYHLHPRYAGYAAAFLGRRARYQAFADRNFSQL
ncbi:MAG: hypothetical protein Q9181_003896 [Wetmoreana brouardii]